VAVQEHKTAYLQLSYLQIITRLWSRNRNAVFRFRLYNDVDCF